ncbi:glycosyltransferase [Phocicoccus pinnipedialis]|uniref:Glycosyltransferase n=1 Tax=Phocicoccus pinnipedialis TaxID=110845 RepID=A0A6V7RNC9_9BACL|nr:glycosyltransferase [Jeotgalicoccus pinnipedialis]MBP1938809.1 glycosyltransferase involved in cell wall biosynthesis [Jeotgalicoccus pinnipedialis]CAD2079243.1 hypothetical protein JEOPIN946_01537 [Jeotgalicoccus pinnipedialis]
MRILHIISTLQSGGAERMLSNLVSNEPDNEHIIITLLPAQIHYNIDKNVKIYQLNEANTFKGKVIILFKLAILIKKIKPDIVQTWLKINYLAPILRLIESSPKYIINIRHGVNKKYNFLTRLFENNYLNYIDGCIFVSESSKSEFKEIGIDIKKSIVIPNGFQHHEYNYKKNINRLTIGYVGRKDPLKNQDLLFKAFTKFSSNKEVKLIIAGKNMNCTSFIKSLSDIAMKKIEWMGEVKDSGIVYKNIDILILTSLSEGFPNVIGEAMSFGVPVISTNAGESWRIIGDSGYRIHNNVDSVVNIFEHIYNNPSELEKKSKQAYNIIQEQYTLKKIIESYLNYYKGVIS